MRHLTLPTTAAQPLRGLGDSLPGASRGPMNDPGSLFHRCGNAGRRPWLAGSHSIRGDSARQLVDPVRDALGRFAKLLHALVRCVALRNVTPPGVVDQPFGQRPSPPCAGSRSTRCTSWTSSGGKRACVPWSSGGGEDAPGDQPGDPGGGEGPAGVLRVPEGSGRVPPGGGDERAATAPAADPHPSCTPGGGLM